MTLAIIAGRGDLPLLLFQHAKESVFVSIEGEIIQPPSEATTVIARYEKLGTLFGDLKSHGVESVVFAGALDRPVLDPTKFDATMEKLAPGILAAINSGDDALLRHILSIFENEGFDVVGPADVAPLLTAEAGQLAGPVPDEMQLADSARGRDILDALGPMDVGQGVVVAEGQCLGIETLQGTDAMLRFVAQTRSENSTGVFVKRPKPQQELRVDMPAIGPETIDAAIAAGLSGIEIAAGKVLILHREEVAKKANVAGVSLWATE